MIWAVSTIVLAVTTLLTALRAAWLWWKASRGIPRIEAHPPGSEDHVLQIEGEVSNASRLNAQAALWSGATALLSATTAIVSAMRPLF